MFCHISKKRSSRDLTASFIVCYKAIHSLCSFPQVNRGGEAFHVVPACFVQCVFTTVWSTVLGAQAHSMDAMGRQAGGVAGSCDRAATAAWRLFEPMQSGMCAHPKAVTSADQGLAESIATAMCQMTDCAEMALLWTEVCCTSMSFKHCLQGLLGPSCTTQVVVHRESVPSWHVCVGSMQCS